MGKEQNFKKGKGEEPEFVNPLEETTEQVTDQVSEEKIEPVVEEKKVQKKSSKYSESLVEAVKAHEHWSSIWVNANGTEWHIAPTTGFKEVKRNEILNG